ncbi:MAG: hypothetical protein A2020_06635 [Lentisphaerae bacterium GWF2_45_14]|nr:MAG: hypothetical protein A2020_06635 [Lentisphaerae bacterium GWF2_45_14]
MRFDRFFNSRLAQWKKISGYSGRGIFRGCGAFDIVKYDLTSLAHGKTASSKVVFLSDLHLDAALDTAMLADTINSVEPDWILFGGDLVSFSCFCERAFDLLGSLRAKKGKISVLGNWDKRRRRWFPFREWELRMKKSGFRLLVNEYFHSGNISFYGMDDFKIGHPALPAFSPETLNIIISHNPDAFVGALPPSGHNINLVLCGHTHGGQVRFPFFGPIVTSSIYWRKFDYGHFLDKFSGSEMIISSGIGNSCIDFRLFCRPEILLLYL